MLVDALGQAPVDALGGLPITTPAALAFREHLDVRWDGSALGMIGSGVVIDMATCPLLVPALNDWLSVVRATRLPIARASLRLRAANGLRGVWIDCAHSDVKALLDDQAWVYPDAIIELGPKARRLAAGRLVEPTFEPWSTTFAPGPLPLYTTVRGFSQPGAIPNRALVAAVTQSVLDTSTNTVLELGAGAGNLTLPLLAAGLTVRAVELDGASLARSAHDAQLDGRLTIAASSFERIEDIATLVQGVELIVADPPRQGLGRFIDGLARLSRGLRPAHLVYVSCHPEALARDASRLAELGYRLVTATGIDQFPWSPHAEWVARLSR